MGVVYFAVFFLEISLLFFLSKKISNEFSNFFYRIFKNEKAAGYLIAFLFLPGTLIHELSHYLMAVILRVKAVSFTLLPKIGADNIIMGSVGIVKSDPIRRFFIGISPFIFGISLLLLITHFYLIYYTNISIISVFFFYSIFTIANTMFSSQKDMEGSFKFFLVIAFIIILSYFLGFRLEININLDPYTKTLESLVKILLVPLGIDLFFLVIFKSINRLNQRSF